jgi:DNA-binding transcriptional LysR family regulator
MRLHHFKALVAIADTGSFTRAATSLGVSQSAISHAISHLEEELGLSLMRRDRGGVEFTEAGTRVLGHARAIDGHLRQIEQVAEASTGQAVNTIRVGISQSFAARLLPRLMTNFRARFPHVKMTLREGPDGRIAELLRLQEIDLGVVTLPKPDLVTVPLLRDELYAVLPGEHRLANGPRVPLRRLDGEPLIMPVGGIETTILAALRAEGMEPRVAHRIRDLNTLLEMVAEGHGTAILPGLALPATLPAVRLLPLAPTWMREIGIGVRPAMRDSPPVTAFIGTARSLARSWTPPAVAVPAS